MRKLTTRNLAERLAAVTLLALTLTGAAHAQAPQAPQAPDAPADARSSFDAPAAPFPAFRDAQPLAATYAGDSCGRWDDQFGPLIGVDGTVRAAVTIGSDLYVIGNGITNAGGVPVSNVAKWDGTSWSSIGGTTGQLTCAATDGTNLYVGGTFSTIGGVTAENLARWDGTTWSRMWTTVDNSVNAIAVRDTDIFVGGSFTVVNGNLAASRIVRWNGHAWSRFAVGLPSSCFALAFDADTLYVGGSFTATGGIPSANLAKWDGVAWSAVGAGLNSQCLSLAVDSGGVYASGSFTTAGGAPANRVARWNRSAWSALGTGVPTGNVESVALYQGHVYVAGSFATAGGVSAPNIARWDGVAWSAVGAPLYHSLISGPNAFELLVVPGAGGDRLMLGGSFLGVSGVTSRGVALWDGAAWSGFGSNNGVDDNILTLRFGAGGPSSDHLYACGRFRSAGPQRVNQIARYDLVTHAWSALGSGMDEEVRDIAVSADGTKVYACGLFTRANGVNTTRVAQWDGVTWAPMGAGLNGPGEVIAEAPNGDLYAGGRFSGAGAFAANNIARWNGTEWRPLGAGVNGYVEQIGFAPNGAGGFDVLVAGQFTTAGGAPASRVAKWSGTAWSALGAGVDSGVDELLVDPRPGGYDVYLGGHFLNAGGAPAKRFAKWDGSAWSEVGGGMDASVHALVKYDGVFYVGGRFTTAGGDSAYHIAAWDGSSWTTFGRGTIEAGPDAIVVSDTSVYVGGIFTRVGCEYSSNFARWSRAGATTAVDDAPMAPGTLALSPPAPNPFHGVTMIAFRLPDTRHVSLRVHDVAGREVAILADGVMSAGRHELRFDARGLKHGVYFYTLRAGALVESRKMLIVR